jgi:hypothetical protein
MKKLILSVLLILVVVFSLNNLFAQGFHPSRVRLLAHASAPLADSSDLDVRFHFIPAGNLIGGLAPIAYLGLGIKPTSWLDVESVLGWNFGADEVIGSVRISTNFKKIWSWTDFELRPASGEEYWFSQIDYQLTDIFHVGIEAEGWGNFLRLEESSNGIGPNFLIRFKQMGYDLAIHWRQKDDDDKKFVIKPEFFLRVHFFLTK